MNTKTDHKKSCHKLQAEQIIKNLKKVLIGRIDLDFLSGKRSEKVIVSL